MTDEGIHLTKDGELKMLVGRDAMQLMRVRTVMSGLKMYIDMNGRMILTRGATITVLLKIATEYTGRKYKRTEAARALSDLTEWANLMTTALPIHREG